MLTYAVDNYCFVTVHYFLGGISTLECAKDVITRQASDNIISVLCSIFIKSSPRALFYLENFCEGEGSTCHEPRQYAQYLTRV